MALAAVDSELHKDSRFTETSQMLPLQTGVDVYQIIIGVGFAGGLAGLFILGVVALVIAFFLLFVVATIASIVIFVYKQTHRLPEADQVQEVHPVPAAPTPDSIPETAVLESASSCSITPPADSDPEPLHLSPMNDTPVYSPPGVIRMAPGDEMAPPTPPVAVNTPLYLEPMSPIPEVDLNGLPDRPESPQKDIALHLKANKRALRIKKRIPLQLHRLHRESLPIQPGKASMTYEGIHKGDKCAVKVIRLNVESSRRKVAIAKEFHENAASDVPGFVNLRAIAQNKASLTVYILMDLSGPTLKEKSAHRGLGDWGARERVAVQIATAMRNMLDARPSFFHGRLDSRHITFSPSGEITVLYSWLAIPNKRPPAGADPAYPVTPQQLDVYGLGVVMQGMCDDAPEGPGSVYEDVMARCLSADPAQRPSFHEVVALLEGRVASEDGEPLSSVVDTSPVAVMRMV